MDRRNFFGFLGLVVPGFLLFGCGSSSDKKDDDDTKEEDPVDDPMAAACNTGGAVVYDNPGHAHGTVDLTAQEISDAIPGSYTLMDGGHSHTIDLTATHFSDLKNGMSVTITEPSHNHTVTITC